VLSESRRRPTPPRPCSLRSPKLCELRGQWAGGPPHAGMWLAAHPLAVTGLGQRKDHPGPTDVAGGRSRNPPCGQATPGRFQYRPAVAKPVPGAGVSGHPAWCPGTWSEAGHHRGTRGRIVLVTTQEKPHNDTHWSLLWSRGHDEDVEPRPVTANGWAASRMLACGGPPAHWPRSSQSFGERSEQGLGRVGRRLDSLSTLCGLSASACSA